MYSLKQVLIRMFITALLVGYFSYNEGEKDGYNAGRIDSSFEGILFLISAVMEKSYDFRKDE